MTFKSLNNIRWGIIGAGDVCEVKSGPAFNLIDHSSLAAVMRRNAEKAKDFAQRHKVPRWYSDAEELINDPNVDVVYIATPPDSHMEYTLRVAKAGKPVYVEKPMARNHSECQEMINACEKAGVPLFVAYYRRSLPYFLKVKELVDRGTIGEVRNVDMKLYKTLQPDLIGASRDKNNWRVLPQIAGGGYFHDLASHQLDFLDYLLGPIKIASGFSANQAGHYPADDIVTGAFQFENGALGQGTWCFTSSSVSDIEETTIIGSRGQLRFSFFGGKTIILETEGKKPEIFTFPLLKHIQQPHIQSIVNELRGIGTSPSTGITAARTNKVMDWITG